MKTILITGGAGFLGSNLAHNLIKDNKVIIVDNLLTGKKENIPQGAEFIFADVENLMKLYDRHFFKVKIDEIYHAASIASPPIYQQKPIETITANTIGTHQVLQLAMINQAKVVYFSTSEVYGTPLEHPQREDYWGNVNTIGPRSCYDEAKRLGETYCYIYKDWCDVKIARIFNTYGPMFNDDGRVIINFIRQALANEPITVYGTGEQTRSFNYVDDTVSGLKLIMAKGELGPYNIGNSIETSIIDLAHHIKGLTGSQSPIEFHPLPENDPPIRNPQLDKVKELGYQEQVSLTDGLLRMINWYKGI